MPVSEPAADEGPAVVVDAPESQSLLGLLLRDILVGGIRSPRGRAALAGLRGDVRVRAGTMSATLRFDGRRVVVLARADGPARAEVRGSMPAVVEVARGGSLLGPLLGGGLSFRGNPFVLLKMLPLLRPTAEPTDAGGPS